ncbi:MAG: FIST N-terminal domain-containing protein [Acidobacteriota bacterium]|nr:FIST N-terminal domain-containing protein [Acidobacteriota bacterium]
MTRTAAVYTSRTDSAEAGRDLGEQVRNSLGSEPPDAAVVFVSSQFDYETLLTALDATCHPKIMVGSSSAGEFTGEQRGEGTACVLALQSTDIRIAAGLGHGVSDDRANAAREAVSSFNGLGTHEFPYRSALIMTDALAGHADDLVEQLTVATSGKYQFAGGGAGDDARFARTHVFHGTRAFTNAVVALELLSANPLGMTTTAESAANAAARATEAAVANLRGGQPGSALVFDCVATRLRTGDAFGLELEAVGRMLKGAHFVGCNTYGQIARADVQFGGFHNCTAVVMVLPA